jgi:endonuclease/exonuclease/phosphatase family metal-dependent hydrolase
MITRKTSLIVLLSAAIVLVSGGSGAFAKEQNPLRVCTFNIRLSPGDKGTPNNWAHRKDAVLKFLRGANLDIFGLQEVCPDQAKQIDEAFPDYAKFGEHRNADRKSGEASSIYYRKSRFELVKGGTFWLSETPDVPGKKGWGAMCPRVCSWAYLKDRKTGRGFCFANTHTDHYSALARKEGMLLIINRMKEFAPAGTPIVFTGDHNCTEISEPSLAVSAILDNAMLVSKTTPKGSWRTYNGWKWMEKEVSSAEALARAPKDRNAAKKLSKTGGPDLVAEGSEAGSEFVKKCNGPRIDYIYTSRDISVLDYETVNATRDGTELYLSDHFPIVATVVIP